MSVPVVPEFRSYLAGQGSIHPSTGVDCRKINTQSTVSSPMLHRMVLRNRSDSRPTMPTEVAAIVRFCGLIILPTTPPEVFAATSRVGSSPACCAAVCCSVANSAFAERVRASHRSAQLRTLGYSAADVDTAVVSHLHQDHIGGIAELSSADLLVAEAEWAQLAGFFPEARGFLRGHIDIPGAQWHGVAGEPTNDPILAPFTETVDVMGDGSLVLLATPGHTAGSLSLLVRRRTLPPLLLVGDLTYDAALLERRQLPGVGDRGQLSATTDKVLALIERMPGLVILPAHDPTAAHRLLESTR